MAKKQTEDSIQYFAGLEGVRQKPSVYIGPIDSSGIWTIAREVLDNAVDEFIADRNDKVIFAVDKDGSFWGIDNGQGMPIGDKTIVEGKRKETISTLTLLVSKLHAGGKFGGKNSAYEGGSRGTHGVGIKATNALSKEFQVWTHRDGKWYTTIFAKGKEKQKVTKTKAPKLPHELGTPKNGTVLRFVPDYDIFVKGAKLKEKDVKQWAELTAYLNGGLRISFINQEGKESKWYSKKGAAEYLSKKIEELKCGSMGKSFLINSKVLDLAVAFTDADGICIESYTNGLRNSEGGTHLNAFFSALNDAIKPYKGKRQVFTPSDLREGLLGLLNYKVETPRFDSQTKEKLIDDRATEQCYEICFTELETFFKENKALAKRICERATALKELKDEFHASKKTLKELNNSARKGILPFKALVALRAKPHERELFIVEGDSAKGTCEKARDAAFQEILPLKGKPMNVMQDKKNTAVDSIEVMNILKMVGFNPANKNPYEHIRVGKIIILADADPDGKHINVLTLAILKKFLPKLFEMGLVYIARGPEYIICDKKTKKNYWADSKEELTKLIPNQALMKQVIHLKGWGEVDDTAMEKIAFDKTTRRLYKILPLPDKQAAKNYKLLVGEDTAYRKKLMGVG